ncbi:MAG TPA: nuclear transport factor 2 family protein [Gemmatimonadales bacterium]|nr:nuclear transport factor 2 family protein [Gemmatimonadales bacterium]
MRSMLSMGTVALVALGACQKPPETPAQAQARMEQEAAALRTQVQTLASGWERWTAAGQADSIAAIFVDQGYELPPNAPPVHGRDAIKAFQTQLASMGQSTIHLSVDEVMANGPVGVARGAYEFALVPGPAAPAGMTALADTGKWVGALRQSDGQWRFTSMMWNSNIPLPPPPAPAPAPRRRG